MRKLVYVIKQEYDGMTVQQYLRELHGFSRRIITRIKQNKGSILRNGEHVRMVDCLKAGDSLELCFQEETYIKPNDKLAVPIVYEDEDIIVYNKPPDMPVHPSRNHQTDTLGNAFCAYMQKSNTKATFRPINRLDRDTCGLCLVAKNAYAASRLSCELEKEYTAVVCGQLSKQSGTISAPIARPDSFYIKRIVREDGQRAVTHYEVLEYKNGYSLVKVRLETGRTHQIRVHFSHIGNPLAGDDMYGGSTEHIKYHALCCNRLAFTHPTSGKRLNLGINIRSELSDLLKHE